MHEGFFSSSFTLEGGKKKSLTFRREQSDANGSCRESSCCGPRLETEGVKTEEAPDLSSRCVGFHSWFQSLTQLPQAGSRGQGAISLRTGCDAAPALICPQVLQAGIFLGVTGSSALLLMLLSFFSF